MIVLRRIRDPHAAERFCYRFIGFIAMLAIAGLVMTACSCRVRPDSCAALFYMAAK